MNRFSYLVLGLFTVCWSGTYLQAEDWTRFRGHNGSGISASSLIPVTWSGETNISWKVDLPGPGSSCPIVHGDRVYLTCYTGYGIDPKEPGNPSELKRHLLCFDRGTGKEIWRATVDSQADEDPYKGFIVEHGYASSTPVTDGNHIFTFFGKTGVSAFDMDGKRIWQTSVGTQTDPAKWGGGASPILYKDKIIVNAGNEGRCLVALNKADGSEAWKISDEGFGNGWSTPVLVQVEDQVELVLSIPDQILGIDPDTGKRLWNAKSPIARTVTASVAASDGVIYTLGGRRGQAIAVRCGGRGDVSASHTLWTRPVPSSIGTPVIVDGHMFWLASGSIAMCLSCEDGSEVAKVRLENEAAPAGSSGRRRGPAGSYASPIVAGDNMYFVTRNGVTHVLNEGVKLSKVAVNRFQGDDSLFNATPAVADNQMFVRSNKSLYCLESAN